MKGRGQQPLAKALAAASRVSDNVQRADVLTAVAVLGSLRYSKELIKQLIRSEAMKESPIYQEILREGRTEGRMEGVRTVISHTLERRFGAVPAKVNALLDRIRSFERLEELTQHAERCRTLAAFSKLLP
jgi:predicted transposase YdaD